MVTFEAELERARQVSVDSLADAIESIGFECTRCGACCRGTSDDPHTATVFPAEIRSLQATSVSSGTEPEANSPPLARREWRDVARPMPFGLDDGDDDRDDYGDGETFEWALQTDACGDCVFYDDGQSGGDGSCTVYSDRPLICETYPFSLDLAGSTPVGEIVESVGPLLIHECEGVGRDIDRTSAEALAATLKRRTVRELEEAIAVRDQYSPVDVPGAVVHDSEGAKRPDGTSLDSHHSERESAR